MRLYSIPTANEADQINMQQAVNVKWMRRRCGVIGEAMRTVFLRVSEAWSDVVFTDERNGMCIAYTHEGVITGEKTVHTRLATSNGTFLAGDLCSTEFEPNLDIDIPFPSMRFVP